MRKIDTPSSRHQTARKPKKGDRTSFLEAVGIPRKSWASFLMLIATIMIITGTNMHVLHLQSLELEEVEVTSADLSAVAMPMIALPLAFIAVSPLLEQKMKYLLWLMWGVATVIDLQFIAVSLLFGG